MSDFKHLLPPSATTTMRAIETVIGERTQGIEVPISQLWNVDTCPVDLLPWMAWGFSVEVWDHAWSETVKRNVIRNSVQVHRLKGTRQSVALALEAIGFRIDIVEGWEDGGAPHTFRLDAYADDIIGSGFGLDQALVDTVDKLISNVKPVRAHRTLRVGQSFKYPNFMRFAVKSRQKVVADIAPAAPQRSSTAKLYCRSALKAVAKHTSTTRPAAQPRDVRVGLVARSKVQARQVIRGSFQITAKMEAQNVA